MPHFSDIIIQQLVILLYKNSCRLSAYAYIVVRLLFLGRNF